MANWHSCTRFIRGTMKTCFDTNTNVNLALFQIDYIPIGTEMLSPIKYFLRDQLEVYY